MPDQTRCSKSLDINCCLGSKTESFASRKIVCLNVMSIFFKVLAIACIAYCFAFTEPPVKYLGIDQGLSNNAVTCILQDHNGFMWFGTYDGLNRYDGYSFKIFRNVIGDTTSLNGNGIAAIAEDADRQLWIGTGKGLSLYNPIKGNFYTTSFKSWNNNLVVPLRSNISTIQKNNKDGSLLVGTQQKGLLLFRRNSRTGVQIPFLQQKGHEGDYFVRAIAFDSSQQLAWVFIQQAGLCVYSVKSKSLQLINGTIKKADCLKLDSKGNLWLGNDNGLFLYDMRKNLFSNNVFTFKGRVLDLFEDRQAVIWISTDGNGVWSMPVGQFRPVSYVPGAETSLSSRVINTIYSDRQGNKWIGTQRGGINIIPSDDNLFKHITYRGSGQNNSEDFIFSFAEDQKGNVWISTEGAGLRHWDRHRNTFTNYKHDANNPASISSDFIASTVCDFQGNLWAASWFTGISRLKKGSQKFEHFDCYNPYRGAYENNAWLVFEDSRKQLWVAAAQGGALYVFNRKANRFEIFDATLMGARSMSEDRQGNILLGFQTSLVQIDRVNKKHKSWHIGQSVRSILEDRNKNLWIGTDDGGLLLFDRTKGTYQRFTTADGLPGNTILCMLEDDKNNLWLSTFNGLCKFNTIDKTYRNFSQSDGLQSNQFSYNAALALKSGEFLFGGINGFNIFYPDSIFDKVLAAKIFLTGITINNKPVEEDDSYVRERNSEWIKKVVLPYDKAVLSLDYVALNYNNADKIKYAYKLEGWDKNWIYANNIRTANYSRLREGSYTFKIRLTTGSGNWNQETDLLTVTVLPPWYRTWWAYFIYLLITAGTIYLYIIYNKRHERLKYKIKLAMFHQELRHKQILGQSIIKTQEEERDRWALELHDNVSQLLTVIKLYLDQMSVEPSQSPALLTKAREMTQKALNDIRQLSASIKPPEFALVSLHTAIEQLLANILRVKQYEFILHLDNMNENELKDDQKLMIFRVVQEQLNNIIKYANASQITIRVITRSKKVSIEIIDNGRGFDTSKSKTGIGLLNIRSRLQVYAGHLTIDSEPGKGCRVSAGFSLV